MINLMKIQKKEFSFMSFYTYPEIFPVRFFPIEQDIATYSPLLIIYLNSTNQRLVNQRLASAFETERWKLVTRR